MPNRLHSDWRVIADGHHGRRLELERQHFMVPNHFAPAGITGYTPWRRHAARITLTP